MLDAREQVIIHVFKFTDKSGIHIPVHFQRIINNIHNQLSIQSNSLVNITPLELYELLDDTFHRLNNFCGWRHNFGGGLGGFGLLIGGDPAAAVTAAKIEKKKDGGTWTVCRFRSRFDVGFDLDLTSVSNSI